MIPCCGDAAGAHASSPRSTVACDCDCHTLSFREAAAAHRLAYRLEMLPRESAAVVVGYVMGVNASRFEDNPALMKEMLTAGTRIAERVRLAGKEGEAEP